MDLVTVIIALIIVGAIVYVVQVLPIDATFKTIAKVVAIVALVVWLLRGFGPSLGLG